MRAFFPTGLGRGLSLLLFASVLTAQDLPDRGQPPRLGPAPSLTLPALRHLRLENGLQVVLMEKHDLPLVQAVLIVKAGSVEDPKGKAGLSGLAAAMLMEGSAGLSALEFSEAVEQLGAELSSRGERHRTLISLNVPSSRMDKALSLMAGMVTRPAFAAEELERKRKERLTSLLQARDEPTRLAAIQFNRALYGKGHPYSFVVDDESGLRACDAEDLRRFHAERYVPNNAALVLVGDVTPDQALPLLESLLGGWKQGEVPPVPLPRIPDASPTAVLLVDKPGAPQSVIRIGLIGVPRLTPDYFPLVVMNTLLGGTFTSMLNANLREEHGYTYGAFSYFDYQPLAGPFLAQASVQTEVTDKALVEFMKEFRNIHQTAPSGDMDKIRNYIALSYPRNFGTVGDIADQLTDLVSYDLTDDYFNRYIPAVTAVTAEEVRQAADRHVRMDHLTIVVVGDRKKIEPGIRALKLGPVKVVTIDQLMGPVPRI